MESQKKLVTGGAGVIGTNLVNELRKQGHTVLAVDLYNTERANYLRTDVWNYPQLERVFEKNPLIMSINLLQNRGSGTGRIILKISGRRMRSGQVLL